jgi:hypothetical protein
VYKNGRVLSHLAADGGVVIEADVSRRFADRLTALPGIRLESIGVRR